MEQPKIYNMNFEDGLKDVEDRTIDLVIMDPPYELSTQGGGSFGSSKREYHHTLTPISNGITNRQLDEITRVMKKINIYIWCNKTQLRQYIDYFEDHGASTDLLTWHKTNPTPTCNNKYLSDTEYLLFFREKGVKIYGTYETKHKFYVSPYNHADKSKYNHPTIKPLDITKNLILNSSQEEDLILDPFLGSGTTAVACAQLNRRCIGYEIDKGYYDTCLKRIGCGQKNLLEYSDE